MAKAVACMQLNCHHSTSATANLVNELLESTHIACIQEPHLVKGKPAGLGSQLQYYSKGENPRAVVMASKNINFWPAPQFSSRDMATSIIKQDKLFYIASVYLDITQQDEHFFPSELSSLIEHCKQTNTMLILALDSNCLLYTSDAADE